MKFELIERKFKVGDRVKVYDKNERGRVYTIVYVDYRKEEHKGHRPYLAIREYKSNVASTDCDWFKEDWLDLCTPEEIAEYENNYVEPKRQKRNDVIADLLAAL